MAARKVIWNPPVGKLGEMLDVCHRVPWQQVVYFSQESGSGACKGISKFSAKITRIRHGNYRMTIGKINSKQEKFLLNKLKLGLTYFGGTVLSDKVLKF